MTDLPRGIRSETPPPRKPKDVQGGSKIKRGATQRSKQTEELAEHIQRAYDAGEIDNTKASMLRLMLSEVQFGERPADRTRALKDLGTALGIYKAPVVLAEKDPTDMSTVELLQAVGKTLGLSQLAGIRQERLPQIIGLQSGRVARESPGTVPF